jgi:ketosteroid isomerase-like protein
MPIEKEIHMTTEQEILQQEEQFANAKRTLDLDAFNRIYADDVIVTGVLGEPVGKTAVIDEAKRGIAQRQAATTNAETLETSIGNEDMKVLPYGETAISNYRFVVKVKGQNINVNRRYRTTNVWTKRNGSWQIVATHMAFVLDPSQVAMLSGEKR